MTKLHFQMQREIYRLRQRTRRLEKILEQESQYGRPIIRIPRLTKGLIKSEFTVFLFIFIFNYRRSFSCISR